MQPDATNPYSSVTGSSAAAAAPRHPAALAASILVGLEGLGVAALAGWMTLSLIAGDSAELSTALALLVMTAVGAIGVLAFAIAIFRGHGWGRSGAIVVQLLILAVALGAANGLYAHPLVALALAVPAAVTLVVVIVAARAAGRRDASSDDS
jgi:hypothetical protein